MLKLNEAWLTSFVHDMISGSHEISACEAWTQEHLSDDFKLVFRGETSDRKAFATRVAQMRERNVKLAEIAFFVSQDDRLNARAYYEDASGSRHEKIQNWRVGSDGKVSLMMEHVRMCKEGETPARPPPANGHYDKSWTADSMTEWIQEGHNGSKADIEEWVKAHCSQDIRIDFDGLSLRYEQLYNMLPKRVAASGPITFRSTGWCVQSGNRIATRLEVSIGADQQEQTRELIFDPKTGQLVWLVQRTRNMAEA